VTEISQIENKDEVRSICFAAALQSYFGIWHAGLNMKFSAVQTGSEISVQW
jgi:hypothetical protein